MPTIALITCLAFSGYLIWQDSKYGNKTTGVLWLPTLWLLYCGSRPIVAWFSSSVDIQSTSVAEGSPLDRNTILVLLFFGILILFSRRFRWSATFKENKWLGILLLYMLISIAWSDYPYISFKRLIKFNVGIVMAFIVLTEPNPIGALHTLFRRLCYVHIPLSVVLIKYFTAYGMTFNRWTGSPSFRGVATGKNTLGILCVLCVLYLVVNLIKRLKNKEPEDFRGQNFFDFILLTLCYFLMLGQAEAYSATSLLVLAVGFISYYFLQRTRLPFSTLNKAILSTFFFILISFSLINLIFGATPLDIVSTITGRKATLTGRVDVIWPTLIPIAFENPIFGVGYGAFWIESVFDLVKTSFNQAHNGYIDIFIELGGVGIFLFLCYYISTYYAALKERYDSTKYFSLRLPIIFISLLHNFTESSYLRSTALLWFIFLLLSLVYDRGALPVKQRPGLSKDQTHPIPTY